MISPQLTADGTAVRLPIHDHITAPLLDALAVAYAEDPEDFGRLLDLHAAAVLAADFAESSETTPDHIRHMRATDADATRGALLDELPADHQRDPEFGPDDAVTLGTRLTRQAAHIRMRSTRK